MKRSRLLLIPLLALLAALALWLNPGGGDPWAAPPGRDLIPALQMSVHSGPGKGQIEKGVLLSSATPFDRIPLKLPLPPAYRLALQIERVDGTGSFSIGFRMGDAQTVAVLDAGPDHSSGLDLVDQKGWKSNESTRFGPLFPAGRRVSVTLHCSPGTVRVEVEGRSAVEWSGLSNRLSLFRHWTGDWDLFVGSFGARFRIHRARLCDPEPVPG